MTLFYKEKKVYFLSFKNVYKPYINNIFIILEIINYFFKILFIKIKLNRKL